jgi:hypothetical protein
MATATAIGNGRSPGFHPSRQALAAADAAWGDRVRRWKPGGRMRCSLGNCVPAKPALLVNPVGPSIDRPTKTTA